MPQGMHSSDEKPITLPAIILAVLVIIAIALIGTSMCSSSEPAKNDSQKQTTQSNSSTSKKADKNKTEKSSDKKNGNSKDSNKASKKEVVAKEPTVKRDPAYEPDLSAYTICIDAGHGAHPDSTPSPNNPDTSKSKGIATEPGGTDGVKSGPEYKICLEVALQLQEELEKYGIEVVQVRTTDDVTISPKARAEIANACIADAFIRLHCDGTGSSIEGFYTLVPDATGYQAEDGLYKTSQAMGKRMHAFIVKELGAKDRGITVRSDQGGFNWCMQPAVLFEMANLKNAADDERMATSSYKKKMAKAIAAAIVDYLESLSE